MLVCEQVLGELTAVKGLLPLQSLDSLTSSTRSESSGFDGHRRSGRLISIPQ